MIDQVTKELVMYRKSVLAGGPINENILFDCLDEINLHMEKLQKMTREEVLQELDKIDQSKKSHQNVTRTEDMSKIHYSKSMTKLSTHESDNILGASISKAGDNSQLKGNPQREVMQKIGILGRPEYINVEARSDLEAYKEYVVNIIAQKNQKEIDKWMKKYKGERINMLEYLRGIKGKSNYLIPLKEK